jgi:hypothetical protein
MPVSAGSLAGKDDTIGGVVCAERLIIGRLTDVKVLKWVPETLTTPPMLHSGIIPSIFWLMPPLTASNGDAPQQCGVVESDHLSSAGWRIGSLRSASDLLGHAVSGGGRAPRVLRHRCPRAEGTLADSICCGGRLPCCRRSRLPSRRDVGVLVCDHRPRPCSSATRTRPRSYLHDRPGGRLGYLELAH